jgi:hypothetical protein
MATRSRGGLLGLCVAAGFVIIACTGEDPVAAPPGTNGADGGGPIGTDGGGPIGADGGGSCTAGGKSCDRDMLRTCKSDGSGFDDASCASGCSETPAPHCKGIVPSATGVVPADLEGAGLTPTAITVAATINADTGEITGGLRAANADPTKREIISGIAFHTADVPNVPGKKIGVFSFAAFTVGDGKNVILEGTNAVALISSTDLTVLGVLDARGSCVAGAGGPGGGKGGGVGALAQGDGFGKAGASNASDATSGGGGGGYGDNGGSTPQFGVGGTTAGGLPYGNLTLVPLLGGSGGGRGGDLNSVSASTGGLGGGGGGAVQLVARGKITIGGGSGMSGINAGGCGGGGAVIPNQNLSGCGGGGGSGGAILVEAPAVKLDVMGHLVANGGAGGGGAMGNNAAATAGEPGVLGIDQTQFHGSTAAGAGCGAGGYGGASAEAPSTNKGQNGAVGGTGYCTGGGGGGAGRIRVNSATGAMVIVDASGKLSPRFADQNSHADATASQGKIVLE